jgi:hypothetical protein
MERMLLSQRTKVMNLSGKQYWSIKLSNHSKMYIASLSKAFVLSYSLYIYFIRPLPKEGKPNGFYSYVFSFVTAF